MLLARQGAKTAAAPGATRGDQGDRGRQPEGRGRQDHVDRERRRRAGAVRSAGAGDRSRPPGQRVHRPRGRAPPRDAVELRPAGRGTPAGRGRSRPVPDVENLFVVPGDHRPGRRRDRAGQRGGPRAAAAQGAARGQPDQHRAGGDRGGGPVRLRLHRLPAVAGAAHDQRPGRRPGDADPDPGGVLRARGARSAAVDGGHGPRPPQPGAGDLGHPRHDVRRPDPAGGRRRGRGARPLRRPGHQDLHPALGPRVRGAVVQPDRDDLRSRLARRDELSRRRPRARARRACGPRKDTASERPRTQRRGLGRGLGLPHPDQRAGRRGAHRDARRAPRGAGAGTRRGRVLRRAADRRDPAQRRPAPAGLRRGGDGRARALDPRGRACSSPSWCAAPVRRLRAGDGGAPAARLAAGRARPPSRRSSATPTTPRCSATRCWRTCTGRS